MVYYTPDKMRSLPGPDEVSDQAANEFEQSPQLAKETFEHVRKSETPLAVPIESRVGSTGSLRSIIRYLVLNGVQDSDEVANVSFSKVEEERWVGITTHPSLLEQSNRLLPQAALAKAYQFGYWPVGWSTVEGGNLPKSVDSVSGVSYEQRKMELVWKDQYDQRDFETAENWFRDEKAVTEFADHITDDDISWAQYIPLYRTTAVSTYRLSQTARKKDWTQFPRLPDARPTIKDRFDTSMNPQVGDFIRMAVLRKLERELPIITNLSTGPDPWTTDRVSLVIDPTAGDGRPNGAILCPRVALKKLAEYGYRPTDGWYDAPVIGYESNDPIEPRRIEFARGQALQEWCERIQMQSPLFKDAIKVRETGHLPNIDWRTFVPCVRSQIITYQRLHNLGQNSEALF